MTVESPVQSNKLHIDEIAYFAVLSVYAVTIWSDRLSVPLIFLFFFTEISPIVLIIR